MKSFRFILSLVALLSLLCLSSFSSVYALTAHSDGFESGDFSGWDDIHFEDEYYNAKPIIVSNVTHWGNYAAYNRNASLGGTEYCSVTWWGPQNSATINPFYARGYYRFYDDSEWVNHDYHRMLIFSNSLYDDAADNMTCGLDLVHWTGTTYYWGSQFWNGSYFDYQDYGYGWKLSDDPIVLDTSHWYCVEVGTYIDNTEGWYSLTVDGTLLWNITDLDNNEVGLINHVDFGNYGWYPLYWDDCACSSLPIGLGSGPPTGVYTVAVAAGGIVTVATGSWLFWWWRRIKKTRTVSIPP